MRADIESTERQFIQESGKNPCRTASYDRQKGKIGLEGRAVALRSWLCWHGLRARRGRHRSPPLQFSAYCVDGLAVMTGSLDHLNSNWAQSILESRETGMSGFFGKVDNPQSAYIKNIKWIANGESNLCHLKTISNRHLLF